MFFLIFTSLALVSQLKRANIEPKIPNPTGNTQSIVKSIISLSVKN